MADKPTLAKISRPHLRGVLLRERLFALFDGHRGRPVVWVWYAQRPNALISTPLSKGRPAAVVR